MIDKETVSTILPGFAIALTAGFAANFLGEHYGAPAMLFALLLGMALGFLYEDPKSRPGIDFCARSLLRFGVALLGFRILLADVMAVDWKVITLVIAGVATTILFGMIAARLLGLSRTFGSLTGGAVAICGASAAMALSAVLKGGKDHERDTAFAVVGVTSLSTLAMIFYPVVTSTLGLDNHSAGIFIGATIHDVAQVVGAGYSISGDAGDIATLTKLMRVALLLPVVFLFIFAGRKNPTEGEKPPLLPMFLVGFIVAAVLNNLIAVPPVISDSLNGLSRICLVTAIAAIGLKTNLRNLATVGLKPVILMVLETVWLAGLVLAGLMWMG